MLSGRLSVPELSATVEEREVERHSELDDDQEPTDQEPDELRGDFLTPAEFSDAVSQRADDVFAYISARANQYGSSYPFEVTDRRMVLREPRTDRLLYLFLLVCASFRYIPDRALRTRLAAEFEWVCHEVMKRMLPAHAETRLFGKNSVKNGEYVGTLFEKIALLASDLGERRLVEASDFEPGDSGDNGLDLVSWIPMGDHLASKPVFFGQCACTVEWVVKQHSSSRAAWNRTMTFSVPPQNICFMPFDFRNPSRTWFMERLIHESVLMDRWRIMHYLGAFGEGDLDAELADVLGLLALDEIRAAAGYDLV